MVGGLGHTHLSVFLDLFLVLHSSFPKCSGNHIWCQGIESTFTGYRAGILLIVLWFWYLEFKNSSVLLYVSVYVCVCECVWLVWFTAVLRSTPNTGLRFLSWQCSKCVPGRTVYGAMDQSGIECVQGKYLNPTTISLAPIYLFYNSKIYLKMWVT